jgi:hypothetical protein
MVGSRTVLKARMSGCVPSLSALFVWAAFAAAYEFSAAFAQHRRVRAALASPPDPGPAGRPRRAHWSAILGGAARPPSLSRTAIPAAAV